MEAATKTTDIEGEISRAMRARVKDFKEQADSLTLEGIRRALEKELEMERFSLDVHKMFIKQCLSECFTDADDESESRTLETAAEAVQPVKDEASIQHEDLQPLGFASNGIKLIGENTLNVYKGFIRKELDTVLVSAEPVKTTDGIKKLKKASPNEVTEKIRI